MKMGFGGKMMKTMKKLILASITLLLAMQTSPKEGEIIEIDVTLVSPSQQLESKKYIKTRKHK